MPLPPVPRPARRRPRRGGLALAALALLAPAAGVAQQPFDVALRDGLLSIRANGASVTELVEALAAETGISFVVTGDAGTPITAEIVDEPFAKAVAKLSPNHLLVRESEDRDSPVTEVVLMLDDAASGGGGGGDGFLPSGAPADEIVGDDSGLSLEGVPVDETMQSLEPDVTIDGGVGTGLDPSGADPLDQGAFQDAQQPTQ